MITTSKSIDKSTAIKTLPPPWEATHKQVADVSAIIGQPIVYDMSKGWQPIPREHAAVIGVAMDAEQKREQVKPVSSPVKRLGQLQRVLTIIECLSPLKYGAPLDAIARDVSESIGEHCERTYKRDLEALELLGFVRREVRRSDRRTLWIWQRHDRGEPVRLIADVQAELRLAREDDVTR